MKASMVRLRQTISLCLMRQTDDNPALGYASGPRVTRSFSNRVTLFSVATRSLGLWFKVWNEKNESVRKEEKLLWNY